MEETISKRGLSTPTKPPSKRAATFASPKKLGGPNAAENQGTAPREKYPSHQGSMTTVSIGQTTSQALTEVDKRQHVQADTSCSALAFCHGKHEKKISPLEYSTGVELCESKLLLYSLLAAAFPDNSFRARYHEKYLGISSAIERVFHVNFGSTAIANYLYRANNNLRRDLGKVNGILRWKYYREEIERIVRVHLSTLQGLISSRDLDSNIEMSGNTVTGLRQQLTQECLKRLNSPEENIDEESQDDMMFETKLIECLDFDKFPDWKKCFNVEDSTGHLFYFGGRSIGYCQIEIIINSDRFWKIRLEGRERRISLDWADVFSQINCIQDLNKLMATIQSLRICSGCSFEEYQTVVPPNNCDPVYFTRNGEPAAFAESSPSQHHKKIIRSTNCLVFIPYDEALSSTDICAACEHSKHYLRTLKSRLNSQGNEDKKNGNSKFTRFDYLSKEELVCLLRERTVEMRHLQEKVKKLEKCRERMVEVGGDTDSDFRIMFEKVNEGLKNRKNQISKCKWKGCSELQNGGWEEADQLYVHARTHIEIMDDKISPMNRVYSCHWDACAKKFGKKRLLEEHLRDHTGFSSDQFFAVLLNDQAKALTVPKRQMRWHPLVIKWCLRMFSKSHAAYEDLRESGFLKLPSGRLLSDYKNFSSPRSGWQTSTLSEMKQKFEKTKIGKRGQLGGLFFDEVKIKEGLVFDPSTFELVGFTDLDDDETNLPSVGQLNESDSKPENKLATHVLQFYFKSLFGKFDFPCAFFLTRGITAQK